MNKIVSIVLLLLISCSKEEEPTPPSPTISTAALTGLLGEKIHIEGAHLEYDKLQVFFDNTPVKISFITPTIMEVTIPRNLERFNPTLKVIDLVKNEDIFRETFTLKTPEITGFQNQEITFGEHLVIEGENFDELKDYVEVFINDKKAAIIYSNYNKITVTIPYNLKKSDLEVKVYAQLQEVFASNTVALKQPEITNVVQSEIWLGGYLNIEGVHFNPDYEYAEIFVNGTPAPFSRSTNNLLSIHVPHGPYTDFSISNITYKTAGLTTSFDTDIEILNNSIKVDEEPYHQFPIFIHQNKAFSFITEYIYDDSEGPKTCTLINFSSEDEKWRDYHTFQSEDKIIDVMYDGKENLYLYKINLAKNQNVLTLFNLNNFSESEIQLPFNDIRINATLFSHQEDFYFFHGDVIDQDRYYLQEGNQAFKYDRIENEWTELSLTDFPEIRPSDHGRVNAYLEHNGSLYIDYDIQKTLKINPDMSIDLFEYNLLFLYEGIVFGRHYYGSNDNLLRLEENCCRSIPIYYGNFRYNNVSHFFSLDNEIYFSGIWMTEGNATNKFKKELINELL